MFEPLVRMIRRVGTTMAVVVIVGIVMLAFGLGESLLGKLLGTSVIGLLLFLRHAGAGGLHAKVDTIVQDKAQSIFGSMGEPLTKPGEFDADEALSRYMEKRKAGLTDPPPPDVGAIRQFGRKRQ
ncbi:MAG: hypothetical protein EX258_01850 [Sphingomonadaceae bacterium]|nr:MAG: hypothetical protein EX258_01850 [Sphingomonadaceae bacterium]